ncbi:neural cell adhesion molecule 1 [Toxotes jaculatrix]|uniref:neural cell adhesion molecule 1 n=1 Tax=Toxotes jaculatrix TaxID=941984 RepID=UPI001B3AF751|nr:neural cell adhesion molecule 1 [Toxotes jaculatrix]
MTNQLGPLKLASLLLLLVYGTDAKMDIIVKQQDVLVGAEILLLCKAGREGTIKWQKDGEDIDDDEIVSTVDETSSRLHILKATIEDAGKYTCHCDYDSGHQDDAYAQMYVYEGPSFGSTKTYHEFLVGTNGVVPCVVTGKPAVDVQWFRDKKEIPSNEGERVRKMTDNTLRIENVKREDAGTYVCQAKISGRPVSQELLISVFVNVPPTVHLREEVKKVMAGSETNVSLLCLVDGIPKPNISWTMPVTFDSSRHHFNSDSSQLTIQSVTRADYGEYVCTAANRLAEDSATIMLHVFEAPEVFLSAEQKIVSVGERVSVSCNVSGHPQPELHWLKKNHGYSQDFTSGRIQVADGVLVINEILPSDGGLYSCMAVSDTGNASRDVAILTQPGPPHYLSVSPGPTSVLFSLKIPPISGGSPITGYVLQWRQSEAEQWKEITVPTSDPLAITALNPYTLYRVRLAALNAVGRGQFSDSTSVRTQGIRGEPDSPHLSLDEVNVESNSFSVPLKQIDDGGTPLLHFNIRYRKNTEGAEWKEIELSPDADSVSLQDLSFGSHYQLEVTAINANGSSTPATFNFTTAEQPMSNRMTKGSVIGIVMVIFLVVFLVVDATCCYRNRCGLLMSIGVKLFGQKVPGIKMLEEGAGTTNGDVKLKGISTPRGSMQQAGVQTLSKEGTQLTDVTCDKAPLTKHEKIQPDRHLPIADA